MNKQHPLKFFIDFAELQPLKSWEDEFYESAIPEYDNPAHREAGYIVSWVIDSNNDQVETNLYFEDVLADKFLEQKSFAKQAMDIKMFETTDSSNAIVKLTILKTSVQSIIKNVTLYEAATVYPFILNTCNDLLVHIENHLQSFNYSSSSDAAIKIKWLANYNVLAQLFFDLLNGQNGQPSFIQIEKALLGEFIKKHFTDDWIFHVK